MANAQGRFRTARHSCVLVDIPGTYSLLAQSAEEEVARNFICFGGADAVIVVCDATCLERNLNLVLQTLEITRNVILCVNLMDEARKKKIRIDPDALRCRLGIPVVTTTARSKHGLEALKEALDHMVSGESCSGQYRLVDYPAPVEQAVSLLEPVLDREWALDLPSRWLALQLLNGDASLIAELESRMDPERFHSPRVEESLRAARGRLQRVGYGPDELRDAIVGSLLEAAAVLSRAAVTCEKPDFRARDRKADFFLTSRRTGYPVMIALLALVFWITIVGANYPSQALSRLLFGIEDRLLSLFTLWHAPEWLSGMLVSGMYRVLAWVVSVMLPPMAIFFPMFTLLEDVGYLPRIAYNLDYPFKKCRACGKQALTMAMGFGCNAAGIVGCRIIDSPRERLIAMLTNSFVPCNGRFPTLIAIFTMFFIGSSRSASASLPAAGFLTLLVLLGVFMTFAFSRLLSGTLLRGAPSSFTLELPPYRKPQIGRVIVRSIFDRTIFVLGRAACVAAPAGIVVWLLANIRPEGVSLLRRCADFLDPFGRLMGMDGVILIAFILGLPANEIVFPIIVMAYLSQGSLMELGDLNALHSLLKANGWTWVTAVSVCLFSLMHWPCSTTLLTIRRETGSMRWMLLAMAIPTAAGIAVCICFASIAGLFL